MKQVNIREFKGNMYKYLPDLPIIVTKRGKPEFVVTKLDNSNVTTSEKEDVVTSVEAKVDKREENVTTTPETDVVTNHQCNVPRCNIQAIGKYIVGVQGDFGAEEKEMYLCGIHARKLKGKKIQK